MKKKKILSWSTLKHRLKAHRSKGKKIVFTNGCFDIIHAGHVKVFSHCKKWGDVLVVGLNSDKSVRRLKGPQRPIVSQRDRAELLAGLEDIDYVTIFNQDTPDRLIQALKPHVLAKGGDWKPAEIVGRQFVKKVVRIPLLKGRSTTNLIDQVLKKYGSSKKKTRRGS